MVGEGHIRAQNEFNSMASSCVVADETIKEFWLAEWILMIAHQYIRTGEADKRRENTSGRAGTKEQYYAYNHGLDIEVVVSMSVAPLYTYHTLQ